jgi:uncharacterized protein (DUF362 family)/ferredoxin
MLDPEPEARVQRMEFDAGTVDVTRAWTTREVRAAVQALLAARADSLPRDRSVSVLIKPNLNNDLVALTGNSTDLRVLCSIVESLRDLGYTNITVADGPNVGVERRFIDVFKRLRVRALERRYGVRLVDLNRGGGRPVRLEADTAPRVAHAVLDAGFVISVPTVKTHAEAGLSCACKNWVGICVGQDKRQMHLDLGRNIARLIAAVPPHLVIVDGIVGMQGNGPGDGDPMRLGIVAAGDSPWLVDLVIARLIDFPWRNVPYLVHGHQSGSFSAADAARADAMGAPLRTIVPAPPRSRLAEWSEARSLLWLKKLVRPITSKPQVAELAYRARIIQDVYGTDDDTITGISRKVDVCGDCRRCEDFCPTHLPLEEIGTNPEADCIHCLYCWWSCPKGAIDLVGELGAMERAVDRYKSAIERL